MNNISKLYWVVFWSIFSLASTLIVVGCQSIGIIILLILGFLHLIVFHIAENNFMSLRLKITEIINSVIRMVALAWKAKSIISLDIIVVDAVIVKIVAMAMYVIYLAITTIAIAVIGCFFVIKKLYKPKLKTFQ